MVKCEHPGMLPNSVKIHDSAKELGKDDYPWKSNVTFQCKPGHEVSIERDPTGKWVTDKYTKVEDVTITCDYNAKWKPMMSNIYCTGTTIFK